MVINISNEAQYIAKEIISQPGFAVRFCSEYTTDQTRSLGIIQFVEEQVLTLRDKGLKLDALERIIIADQKFLVDLDSALSSVLDIRSGASPEMMMGCYKRGIFDGHKVSLILLPSESFGAAGNPLGEIKGTIFHEMTHAHDDYLSSQMPEVKNPFTPYADECWSEYAANKIAQSYYSAKFIKNEIDKILMIDLIPPCVWIFSPQRMASEFLKVFGHVLGLIRDEGTLQKSLLDPLKKVNPDIGELLRSLNHECEKTNIYTERPILGICIAFTEWLENLRV